MYLWGRRRYRAVASTGCAPRLVTKYARGSDFHRHRRRTDSATEACVARHPTANSD
jgi:hypothetical protein